MVFSGLGTPAECPEDLFQLKKPEHFQEDKCIDCGNCTAVCFAGALTMDKTTWKLNFDKEKCVVCELCIIACPLKLFNIDFS